MKEFFRLKIALGLGLLLPICGLADDFYTSTLTNDSKTAKSSGYYLVQDKTWSAKGCLTTSGKNKLNPGDTAVLKIKKGCKWGGVAYKVYQIKDNTLVGSLGHSFHGNTFYLETSKECSDNKCAFHDLNLK